MNATRKELLTKRFNRAINKAILKKGYLSLATIIESQYYLPRRYPMKLKEVNHVKNKDNA
ncbi:hypothetical protein ACPV30_01960 [Photobacterium damselae]|uniref:hypothetical protein n=1 Tax=Photobacterium damselae TaxID=38293 RepID=UPI00406921F5